MQKIINQLQEQQRNIEKTEEKIEDIKHEINNGVFGKTEGINLAVELDTQKHLLESRENRLDNLKLSIKIFFDELPEDLQNETFDFIRGR